MINKVYILLHTKEDKLQFHEKDIGIFSSFEIAVAEKIKREKALGFIDYPNGFRVEVFEVDKDGCQEIIYLK